MTEPINKIPTKPSIGEEPQHRFLVQVTDLETNEVIYLQEGVAGIACIMEKVDYFGLETEGIQQHLAWGNPILQVHCFDQMQKWFKEKGFFDMVDELERRGLIKSSENFKDLLRKK